jgi:cytochrome c oxidase subunit 2
MFKKIPHRRILLASVVVLAVAVLAPHGTRAQSPRVINITAQRFEFTPNQVTLKKGEPVKFVLTSKDVTHGFFLKPLKIDEIIEPGKTTEVTVTPQTPGTYLLICDHFCGVNHAAMNMKVIVE